MNRLYHYCDNCGNRLEDSSEEIPIEILEMPDNSIYFFCGIDCLYDFINDHMTYGYILPNGSIDRD